MFAAYERKFQAILHRRDGNKRVQVWTRTYARLETACRRAVELCMIDGKVGDVIEVTHMLTGHQYGTVKYHADGRLSVAWTEQTKQSIG
jgi:hypothetical protein